MIRSVVALDLGSTKVSALAAQLDESGHPVARAVATAPCKGLKRGVVADLDEASAAVDQALREIQGRLGAPVESVVASVGGPHLEALNAQGFVPIYPRSRPITREDVLHVLNHSRQILTPPDREQLQAITREYRIDGQRGISKPVGMNGAKLEVVTLVVTGQTTHIQNVERAVEMTGRKVDQMVVSPIASGVGVLTDEEADLGTVVVDVGGGTTDVAIFTHGTAAYVASVPVGGAMVTSDLSKLLKTSPEEAERLKFEFGAATSTGIDAAETVMVHQIGQDMARPLPRKILCEIVESRMRETATFVRQQIERSGLMGMLPGGIVLTGGGSLLPETATLFEQVMGHMRVRVQRPRLKGPRELGDPALTTVAGLALYALASDEDDIAPANGLANWKERFRNIKSILGR